MQQSIATARAATNATLNGQDAQIMAIQRVEAAIRSQASATSAAARQTGNDFGDLERRVSSFQAMVIAAFGLNQIKQFGEQVIEAKSKMDVFALGMTQMLGSKRESMELMAQIQQLAVTTPFQVDDLMAVTQRLKGMGVATKDLIPDIKMLGDIAAIAGTEKLPLIAKAYTDVMNKGKLMKGEINQFAENGVPLYDLLATTMGKTRDEVVKMAEAHTIGFADVKKALQDATSEGGRYFGMMSLQSQTLAGQTSNLADKFFYAKARIGDFFEDTIKGGISTMSKLIDVLFGSNEAIQRTVSTISAATAAWIAGRTALTLYNAQALIAAGQTDKLTLSQKLLTIGNAEAAAATTASTVSLRGLWAVMAANPLGALLTAISLAVAAWQGYEAITTEVAGASDETSQKLQTEQAQLNILAQQVMGYNEGSERRRDLLQMLISQYPDYFSGLSAETLNNAQLKSILDKVNLSYERRIELARSTYLLEKANKEMQTLWDREDELMMRARQRLSEDMMAQVGNDSAKLLKLLQTNSQAAGMMGTDFKSFIKGLFTDGGLDGFQGMLTSLRSDFSATETKIKTANEAIVASQKEANKSLLTAENERHTQALAQLKAGTADYAAEVKKHEGNVANIKNEGRQQEYKAVEAHVEKVKTITVLSQKQIAALLTGQNQESFAELMASLNAQEKAEIEAANKRVVNVKTTEAQMVQIRKDVSAQILDIHETFEKARERLRTEQVTKFLDSATQEVNIEKDAADAIAALAGIKGKAWKEAEKERKKDTKEALQEVEQMEAETARQRKENLKAEEEYRKEVFGRIMDFASQQGGVIALVAQSAKGVWEGLSKTSDITLAESAKNLTHFRGQLVQAQADMFDIAQTGSADAIAAQKKVIAEAEANVESAVKKNTEVKQMTANTALTLMGVAYQFLTAIADMVNGAAIAQARATAEAAATAREALKNFTEESRRLYRDMYEWQIDAAKGNLKYQLELLDAYYQREHEVVTSQSRIDDVLNFTQRIAEIRASDMDDDQKIMAQIDEYRRYTQTKGLNEEIAASEVKKAKAKEERDLKLQAIQDVFDAEKERIDKEIDAAKELYDQKKDLIEKERDAKKDALNAERDALKEAYDAQRELTQRTYDDELNKIRERQDAEKQALKDTYDYRQSLVEQSKADELEATGIIDRLRDEALERYRTTETDKLIAQRNRILATLTDEGERARVTEEYENRIKQVHQDVEDAKLDKSKANTLVSKQLKQEEKDLTEKLKEEETAKLLELEKRQKEETQALKTQLQATLDSQRDVYEAKEKALKAQLLALEASTKAQIEAMQAELKATILSYQNQLRDNEVTAMMRRAQANLDYSNASYEANRHIFEANKQIAIVELRIAVAKLKAAGGNRGLIDELNGLIESIGGQRFDPNFNNAPTGSLNFTPLFANGGAASGQPFALAGIMQNGVLQDTAEWDVSYKSDNNPNGGGAYVDAKLMYDASAAEGRWISLTNRNTGNEVSGWINYAAVYDPATGRRYAQGTEYVDGPYPTGTDTIPAMLNRGERVIPTEQNALLGNISNTELVARMLQPRLAIPTLPARLNLPDSVGVGSSNAAMLNELQLLRREIREKELLQLSIDNGGIAAAMIAQDTKTTFHANRFQF